MDLPKAGTHKHPLLVRAILFCGASALVLLAVLAGWSLSAALSFGGFHTAYAVTLLIVAFLLLIALVLYSASRIQIIQAQRLGSEESRRLSEQRLSGIIASAMDAIITVDESQRIVLFNSAAERVFRCKEEDVLGKSLDLLIPERFRSAHAEHLRDFTLTGRTNRSMSRPGELAGRRADGSEFPIEATISQVQSDAGRLYTVILRDVTERRRAETELRAVQEQAERNSEQLRTILENMSERLYVCDGDGNPLLVNENARATYAAGGLGAAPPTISEMGAMMELFSPDGRLLPLAEWPISRVTRGEKIRAVEVRVRMKKTGDERVLSCSGAPVRDGSGKVIFSILSSADITDRKSAEEALRDSEERFHALVEHASDAVFLHDSDGRFLDVNRQACESLGYTRRELLNMSVCDVEQDFDLASAQAAWSRIEAGTPFTLYGHQRRKDGSVFPAEVRLSTCHIDGRRLILGLVRDITVRRQEEEKLRLSEEKFAKAFNINPGAMVIARRSDGRILEVNKAFLSLFQCTHADVLGISTLRFWPDPNDRSQCMRELEANGSYSPREQVMLRWSREPFLSLISGVSLTVAGEPVILSTLLDISDRKRAEEALRASEERLSLVVSAAGLGVWDRDIVNDRHTWSPHCCSLFGLPPDCSITFEVFMGCIHPDDRERVAEAIRASLERNEPYVVEYRVQWPDGSVHWLSSHGRAYFDDSGKPVRMSGIAQEVTQRKLAEDALIRSEKLASVGRMAAAIAHEINNPLAATTNLLYLAKLDQGVSKSTRLYLENAEAELQRVAHITRQSLGFYRESNAPSRVSVHEVIESAIGLLKSKVKSKHASIERRWSGDIRITAVAGELRQVFANLLSNSIDAIDDRGKIRFRISRNQALGTGKPYVRVTVADSGHGIAKASLPHVFEPFFTTKGTVGTGLGLWVSKQIIDKHAGAIRARSGARGGTVFSVTLPMEGTASLQGGLSKSASR